MAQNHRPQIIDRMVHKVLCQVIQKISKKHWWFQWFPSKSICCRYSICLSVYLSIVYLSICLSVYLSISLSLSLSIHPYIHPSIYRSMQKKKTNPKSSKKKSRVCWPSTLPRHLPSSFQLRCSPQGVHADPARGRRFQIEKWDVVKSIINGTVLTQCCKPNN